jgi:RluA family pseudouridine synthase
MSIPAIPILLENDALVAVDKPEGISTIPERDLSVPSVLTALQAGRTEKLFVVHRLDKEVSGVLLFATTAESHRALCMQFEARTVRKTYVALVHGRMESDRGRIEKGMRQFGSGRMGIDEKGGKPCVTEYDVVKQHPAFAEIRVHPHTGRRHQIRVHLYSIGHPVAGDRMYGDAKVQTGFARLMLHAEEAVFQLPGVGETVVRAAAPESYLGVLRGMEVPPG